MDHKDFRNKLRSLVIEELNNMINEEGRFGSLLNDKDFDPVDPEVHITGYGAMSRSSLRREIARRLSVVAKSAADAVGKEVAYDDYTAILELIGDNGMITKFIKADQEVSDELEARRTKGGRRTTPIPKQK
jgi:hypothetical protein